MLYYIKILYYIMLCYIILYLILLYSFHTLYPEIMLTLTIQLFVWDALKLPTR